MMTPGPLYKLYNISTLKWRLFRVGLVSHFSWRDSCRRLTCSCLEQQQQQQQRVEEEEEEEEEEEWEISQSSRRCLCPD